MNVIEAIVDGVKAVAPTVANYVLPGSGPLLHKLIRDVAGDPPETPIEASAAKVAADPALYVELQSRIMAHEEKLAEIDLKREEIEGRKLESVNQTMREEGKSEHWPQWAWRPFNGFLYGTTIFCCYFLLPACGRPVPQVPEWVWIGWGTILGVTTWHRGAEKRVKAGEQKDGLIVGTIKAIRGK